MENGEGMPIRSRSSALSALLALVMPFVAASGRADVVWRVADEGPRAPGSGNGSIFGNDSRVIWYGEEGTWELDGSAWRRIEFDHSASQGERLTPSIVARDRLVAATFRDGGIQLFALEGNVWKSLASVEGVGPALAHTADRLYVTSAAYFPYETECRPGFVCTPDAPARRLRSVSLADGTVREEPPLPSCYGTLFVLAGKLHLLQEHSGCGGPGSGETSAASSPEPALPIFRLDGDHWVERPPWVGFSYGFRTTPNSAWRFQNIGSAQIAARILTTSGFSDPIQIPRSAYGAGDYPKPFEWNGRLLVSTTERRGNILELRDGQLVRLEPESPVTGEQTWEPFVEAVGRRLFTWAKGWEPHVFESTQWLPTSGLESPPGADRYATGATKLFATLGTRVFRRDAAGWTRLSPVPAVGQIWGLAALEDRPVIGFDGGGSIDLFMHEPASDTWVDLKLPRGFGGRRLYTPPSFEAFLATARDAVYVSGDPGKLARYRGGSWTSFSSPPPEPGVNTSRSVLRVLDGVPYVFDWGTYSGPTAWLLKNDRFEPAFPNLDQAIRVRDACVAGGRLHLAVSDATGRWGNGAALMTPSEGGFQTLVTGSDLQRARVSSGLPLPLAAAGDMILLGGLAYSRGQLRAQRGPLLPRTIDYDGRFAYGYKPHAYYDTMGLLSPAIRVRKSLAAVVDTAGVEGVRYRSTLLLANFSRSSNAVARLFPGRATTPVREVPLGPGGQVRIEDPVPGFVGPLAVEFEGLEDETEAWAAVRVWSPSAGGTAGTSLLATDPGSVLGEAVALPPVRSGGDRLHAAISADADVSDLAGETISIPDLRESIEEGGRHPLKIPIGGFLQVDPHPERVARPFVISAGGLLGYLVRNDGVTNDGTVVPFEPPDTLPGRRTRFLPAVVGVASSHAVYRTELTLGWRAIDLRPVAALDFLATWRDERGSTTFSVSIPAVPNPFPYDRLDAGVLLEIPDAGAWLAANGVPIDHSAFAGTLTFSSDRPEGAGALLATAVVQARSTGATGDYGVSVPVVNEVRWADERAVVPGLREDAGFRSNVAVANPEPDDGPVVTLEVTLHQASDGSVIGILPQVTLPPGRRFQWNRPLSQIGYGGEAWAEVRRVAGSGRFVAYGVVNDSVTSDGTLLPMTTGK